MQNPPSVCVVASLADMAVSISRQLAMLALSLLCGVALGLGVDLLWFLRGPLGLPGRRLWDTCFLLLGALLLFTLFQSLGGIMRPDLLLIALGGASLYAALLSHIFRRGLAAFAYFLLIPLKFTQKVLKKAIDFLKKSLANDSLLPCVS